MLYQSQLQKQSMKILPQQIQMLGIYHLNTLDLDQRIKDELDENPLLESAGEELVQDSIDTGMPEDFKDYDEFAYDDCPNYIYENQSYIHNNSANLPIKEIVDFRTSLKQQLINLNLSELESSLAIFIIDEISDNGFLERSVQEVADDFSFMQKSFVEETLVEKVLLHIQELEPLGVGCRNISEFFLKQLKQQKQCPIVKKCISLIADHFNYLQKRNFDRIIASLQIEDDELGILLKHIAKLQIKPVNIFHENQTVKETIIPDFMLAVDGENVMVDLYKQRSNSLHINYSLVESIENTDGKTADEKSAALYLKSKLSSAQWFVEAIRQREENMMRIARAIVKKQKNYFIYGDASYLKPMILKHIADEIGLDISTVSRVTCNKYVDTPFGLILLKDLFTEGIVNEQGISVSNKVVQIKLKEIIDEEDRANPYNDQQLVKMLEKKGIKVARRTIAKYRELMNIPVGIVRSIWAKAI